HAGEPRAQHARGLVEVAGVGEVAHELVRPKQAARVGADLEGDGTSPAERRDGCGERLRKRFAARADVELVRGATVALECEGPPHPPCFAIGSPGRDPVTVEESTAAAPTVDA